MTQLRLPLAAALLCLTFQGAFVQDATIHRALAQAAYIRPLAPPPEKPAHGFYIDTIELKPESLDTDNKLYTATIHVNLQDLPSFEAKSQAMVFSIPHIKAEGTIQDLRNEAKKQALAHFGEVIGTLQKYKDDFAKSDPVTSAH